MAITVEIACLMKYLLARMFENATYLIRFFLKEGVNSSLSINDGQILPAFHHSELNETSRVNNAYKVISLGEE